MVEDEKQEYADFQAHTPPSKRSTGADLRDPANSEYIKYLQGICTTHNVHTIGYDIGSM